MEINRKNMEVFRNKKILVLTAAVLVAIILVVINPGDLGEPAGSGPADVFGVAKQTATRPADPRLLDPLALKVPDYFRPLAVRADEPATGELGEFLVEQGAPKVRFEVAGNWLAISLNGAGSSKAFAQDNKIIYEEVMPHTDIEYEVYDGLIKETLILKNPSALKEFEFKMEVSADLEAGEVEGGYIPIFQTGTKEEIAMLKAPQGVGSNGVRVDYRYEITNNLKAQNLKSKIIRLILARPGQEGAAQYPIKIDASLMVVAWDEALVKVGENGNEAGNAKDGDIVALKPAGWAWGLEERRKFVIVRVPKLSQEEREKFSSRGSELLISNDEFLNKSQIPNPNNSSNKTIEQSNNQALSSAIRYGLDYTKLATPEQLVKIRDPRQVSPVLDGRALPLERLITEKPWSVALKTKNPAKMQDFEDSTEQGIFRPDIDNITIAYNKKEARISSFLGDFSLISKDGLTPVEIISNNQKTTNKVALESSNVVQNSGLSSYPQYSKAKNYVKPELSLSQGSLQKTVEVGGIAPPDPWMISQDPHYITPTADLLYHKLVDESVIPGDRRLAYQPPLEPSWFSRLVQEIFPPARAATIVTKTIGTASRDYSTITAWETAQDGDLVTLQEIHKGEVYNDSVFDEQVIINGSTTNSSYYMWLTVAAGERHNGTRGSGTIIAISTDDTIIKISDKDVIIEYFELDGSSQTTKARFSIQQSFPEGAGGTVYIRNNLIYDNAGHGIYLGSTSYAQTFYIYNNFLFGNQRVGNWYGDIGINDADNTVYIYNNSGLGTKIHSSDAGIDQGVGTVIAKNNVFLGYTTDYEGSYDAASDYNISSDTTAPGANSLKSKTAANNYTNTTSGSEDLHLKSGADAIDAGVDLSGTFTDDVDGFPRSGTWDIGADELVCDPAWWHCNWTKRRKITLDNSAQSTTLTNFPAAVLLNSSRIDYNVAMATGTDIRFVDADDSTALNYEIEKWDSTATSTLWVKVPAIDTSGTDYIWMYYGNPSASDNSTTTGVWDENFVMVQHLQETDIDGGAGDIKDSTTYHNNGTTSGMNTADQVAGKVDGSFDFDGTDDYVDIADSSSLDISAKITMSAWFKIAGPDTYYSLINKGNDGSNAYGILTNSPFVYVILDEAWSHQNADLGVAFDDSNWHQLTITWDGTTIIYYLDGVNKATDARSVTLATNNNTLQLSTNPSGDNLQGDLDEVRISDIDRSADWIAFEYCNMNDTCNTFGAEQVQSLPIGGQVKSGTLQIKSGTVKIK